LSRTTSAGGAAATSETLRAQRPSRTRWNNLEIIHDNVRGETMTFDFTGKVSLVTGAAVGIGEAAARAFHAAGARVALVDLDEERGTKTARSIGDDRAAAFFQADVSDFTAMEAVVKGVVDRFGRLDVAFNNAGIQHPPVTIPEHSVDSFRKTIRANLRGVFNSMRAEIPAMLGTGGGAIVNAASVMAVRARPGMSAYVASAHGIVGLTTGAAIEYATRGIRVNAVLPGVTDTPMYHRVADAAPVFADDALKATPMGRLGAPREVADAVLWLASEQASFVTGAAIPVDGGAIAAL
jgi:NAD(P)-dependent dehydrogenase (short-subunit alcohol dehydrogenase family)